MRALNVQLLLVCNLFPLVINSQSLSVPQPGLPPWANESQNSTELVVPHEGQNITGRASLRMGADGTFDKPVILVEGFDFGSGWSDSMHGYGTVTWNGIFGGDETQFPLGLEYRPMLDELYGRGADVLFVDYEFGTASIEEKSAFLRHVLELVNSHRVGNQPGVLVGVSMGGVVSRVTLTAMENSSTPHCIGQYYSVDAPHLGAVLPVGFQALVLGLSANSDDGLALWQALNSQAARQLLRHHISDSETFESTLDLLDQFGWPRSSVNLAVVNSQSEATANLTEDPLLRLEWGIGSPLNTSLFYVEANRWDPYSTTVGASYLLPGDLNPFGSSELVQSGSYSFLQPNEDDESLPGSTATHLSLLSEAMNLQFQPLQLTHQVIQNDVTFLPYTSALGIDNSENVQFPWWGFSQSSNDAPREQHASLQGHHRDFILEWIDGLWENGLFINDTIDDMASSIVLGWNSPFVRILPDLTVRMDGQLQIGDGQEPFNAMTSPCQSEVIVQNHGTLLVGGLDGSAGNLRIGAGSQLIIEDEGKVVIYPSSTLEIEPHAVFELNDASLIILPGANLVVHPGATLVLEEESHVYLAPYAELSILGHIEVPDHQSAIIESSGTIIWNSASLNMGFHSSLKQEQSPEGRSTVLGEVNWSGPGQITIAGGELELGSNTSLMVNSRLFLENTDISGNDLCSSLITHRSTDIEHSSLSGIDWQHHGNSAETTRIQMMRNHFANSSSTIENARVVAWDNHFDQTHLRLVNPRPFSRILQNEWNAAWNENIPSLELMDAEQSVWLAENYWRGGIGLSCINSRYTASCNTWELCAQAVSMDGWNSPCFSINCSGGSNTWLNNNIHFQLENAPLPDLSNSNNHFGNAIQWMASGTTTTEIDEWHLEAVSLDYDLSNITSISSNVLATDVKRSVNQAWIDVPWVANNPSEFMTCEDFQFIKPFKKLVFSAIPTNVLGQEVRVNTDLKSLMGWDDRE